MVKIRKIEIENYRGIKSCSWCPLEGINCFVGPGDSTKSTILDAIDYCIGARRTISFSDADFYKLDVSNPIKISITIGNLSDGLKSLDTYGSYLRGFNPKTEVIEDEPEENLETVLTLCLTVHSDLEPEWKLLKLALKDEENSRGLLWSDRVKVAPTRIGSVAEHHLGWKKGSILNKLSEDNADPSGALVEASRQARSDYGSNANAQVKSTLELVSNTASELGIPAQKNVQALLDAQSISISGGTISLHDNQGIPLRNLGTGSTRLLIAGLQKSASSGSSILLLDELEYGLEPHRIIRLLSALGAKEQPSPNQTFLTTHSPVAVRELDGTQIFVTRVDDGNLTILSPGITDAVQGTIRSYPEALLSKSVVVCEGATEIGLLRGFDLLYTERGNTPMASYNVSYIDSGGGGSKPYPRALALQSLGYKVAILRDSDIVIEEDLETKFIQNGGIVASWQTGNTLEDELFSSPSVNLIDQLLEQAVTQRGEKLVDEHIKSISQNTSNLQTIRSEIASEHLSKDSRKFLGKASVNKNNPWFKSISEMEPISRNIVFPNLGGCTEQFQAEMNKLYNWAKND